MSLSLAIVTCGPQLEVALRAPAMPAPSIVRLAGVSPRSTLLLAAVDLLVEDAGLEPASIERVMISRGPGSFTGIRAGLASAAGLAEATGADIKAYDSLLMQAARCISTSTSTRAEPADQPASVWTAQPGRRGEAYAQSFRISRGAVPEPLGELEICKISEIDRHSRWIAAESLDLGPAIRQSPARLAAEALLLLDRLGAESQALEPLYVEGPPIHGGAR